MGVTRRAHSRPGAKSFAGVHRLLLISTAAALGGGAVALLDGPPIRRLRRIAP
ncbi:hypothetical protein [Streptomyces sp. NBC_01431]|uniref:hypothetical protein n=1 Tax=Streptomyces sp. NBC_01431 TaxID=2903863 RepID=UPI002E35303D|nr:hypothetical protein [Streptomyces sp. NBC_01431]